jgi:TatD DNase family protein
VKPPNDAGLSLVDTHVHLHAYEDVDGLLSRAGAAGVRQVVAIGVDLATSRWNVEVAIRRADVVAAVGVHPVQVTGRVDPATLDELEQLARQPMVGLIGEIGIDTIDGQTDLTTQLDALRAQLLIARRVAKPVNLHLRGSVDAALGLIAESYPVDLGAICHYFVGDLDEAKRLIAVGLFISVGKPAARTQNLALRDALAWIPLDRLLLETDSYPLPGRLTEPADLPLVASAIAVIRGCDVAEVARATTGTFHRHVGQVRQDRRARYQ